MALSEIEKLERRYAENPQGLTFAPLAEVHRKNGDVQRALDLLGSGLALHPDYIPASIVLGRCHLDLGDVHAAEKAFLHVLSLDGENVIALKALADISERLVRFDDAERWLHTLLSVDRSNDDAREQLQRIEIARRQTVVGSSAAPDSGQEAAAAESQPSEPLAEMATEPAAVDVAVAEAPPAEAPRLERPAFEHPVAEPAMGWVSQSSQASEIHSPPMEELEPSALREPLEPLEPLDGLVGREVDVPGEADEFKVETSEDIVLRSSGGNEFQVPDASQELFERTAGAGAPPEQESVEERVEQPEPVTAEAEPMPEPESLPELEPLESEPLPEPEAIPEPVPAQAAHEPEPEAVPIDHYPVPLASAPPAESEPAAPMRAYAASETGGRPVDQFLKDILSARPPAQAAAAAVRQPSPASGGGAPTRPAADALSLSSVFGEEEAPGTPPAVPAAGTGAGVTFDDFFGAPGGAPPTQRTNRAPDPKNDDLDQFHAWLQNLKR